MPCLTENACQTVCEPPQGHCELLFLQAADFFGDEQALHAASHALALLLPATAADHDGAAPHAAAQQAPVETSPAAACSSAPALQEVCPPACMHLAHFLRLFGDLFAPCRPASAVHCSDNAHLSCF